MNEKQAKELLERYRKGLCTDDEIKAIEAWADLEVSNQQWRISNQDKLLYRENLKAKIDLATTLNPQETKPPLREKASLKIWSRIAAAAIILLSISTGIFFFRKHQVETFNVQQVIRPGGNKAVLTLANGQQITLSDSLKGEITAQAGMRIKKTSNGQLIYEITGTGISMESEPQYNTIDVPVGGQWQAILSDGSHVWLNAQSSIKFPVVFRGKERKIELKGEAYFEIAHNKSMPFRVVSLGQTVEVLGTHFNVMAYNDDQVTKTTLLEGSVKILADNHNQLLTPGQQAQVSPKGIKVIDQIDLEDVVAWKDGYFKFNGNINDIMSKLSRWYDVEVVYETKPDLAQNFEGEISRTRDLSEVLKIISYTGKVHFEIKGRRIVVKK